MVDEFYSDKWASPELTQKKEVKKVKMKLKKPC